MMRLERDNAGWTGSVTTDWYGDLPMRALGVKGEEASLLINNGNPQLLPRR